MRKTTLDTTKSNYYLIPDQILKTILWISGISKAKLWSLIKKL